MNVQVWWKLKPPEKKKTPVILPPIIPLLNASGLSGNDTTNHKTDNNILFESLRRVIFSMSTNNTPKENILKLKTVQPIYSQHVLSQLHDKYPHYVVYNLFLLPSSTFTKISAVHTFLFEYRHFPSKHFQKQPHWDEIKTNIDENFVIRTDLVPTWILNSLR